MSAPSPERCLDEAQRLAAGFASYLATLNESLAQVCPEDLPKDLPERMFKLSKQLFAIQNHTLDLRFLISSKIQCDKM